MLNVMEKNATRRNGSQQYPRYFRRKDMHTSPRMAKDRRRVQLIVGTSNRMGVFLQYLRVFSRNSCCGSLRKKRYAHGSVRSSERFESFEMHIPGHLDFITAMRGFSSHIHNSLIRFA